MTEAPCCVAAAALPFFAVYSAWILRRAVQGHYCEYQSAKAKKFGSREKETRILSSKKKDLEKANITHHSIAHANRKRFLLTIAGEGTTATISSTCAGMVQKRGM